MNKHTMGPWEAVDNPPNDDGSTATSIYGSDKYVADVYCGYVGSKNMTADEAASNARLIAAAPELLEALEDLASLAEAAMREVGEYDIEAELADARAAIAKATGGEA